MALLACVLRPPCASRFCLGYNTPGKSTFVPIFAPLPNVSTQFLAPLPSVCLLQDDLFPFCFSPPDSNSEVHKCLRLLSSPFFPLTLFYEGILSSPLIANGFCTINHPCFPALAGFVPPFSCVFEPRDPSTPLRKTRSGASLFPVSGLSVVLRATPQIAGFLSHLLCLVLFFTVCQNCSSARISNPFLPRPNPQ